GDDELVVDLRDNPDQDGGPNNLSRDGSVIAAQILFLNVTDPHGPANAGSLRPLRVLTRPGSVFDASPPAAFATYYEVRMRLYDLMWRCLAPHLGGCRDGSPNYVEVVRRDGTIEKHAVVTALEVNEGDVIRLHTGNGGGYGDPRQRPRELVLDDVRNGYVSDAVARAVYGLDGSP